MRNKYHESMEYDSYPQSNRSMEVYMNEQPMSAAEFWWNHLTYNQRVFIQNHMLPSSTFTIELAYQVQWHKVPGYPSITTNDLRKI